MTNEIKKLFDNKTISLATQPKNNELDLDKLNSKKLILIPIDHDYPGFSAAMHNGVFEAQGLDYRVAFVVANPTDAQQIMHAFKADLAYVGGGVGSGFKDKVLPYLDGLADSAKVIGSVNVISKEGGKLIGHNTDGAGFVHGLREEYPASMTGKKIVILGAGGTALPIAYELSREHPKEIVILNRTVEKAKKIATLISPYTTARFGGEQDIGKEFSDADLVINTTNKGAQPNEQYTAFGPMSGNYEADMNLAISNLAKLPKGAIVADILLEERTKTLRLAKEQGYRTHNGMNMNLYQAIPAFRIMTKLNSPDDKTLERIMRASR